jgi:hypothetical protein
MGEIVIELPEDAASEFAAAWEGRRIAVNASEDHRLPAETTTEGFDAATLIEWVIPILPFTRAILKGIAAILVAAGRCL